MSWSFYGTGKPAALKAAIDRELAGYGDPATSLSAREYAAAAPHLKGLLDQCPQGSVIAVDASGHGHEVAGSTPDDAPVLVADNLGVSIRNIGRLLE